MDSSTCELPSVTVPSTGIFGPGSYHHDVADQHFGGGDVELPRPSRRTTAGRRQLQQRLHRVGGAGAGAHFEPVAEQDEGQQDRRGLVEVRPVEEGRRNAETVSGPR